MNEIVFAGNLIPAAPPEVVERMREFEGLIRPYEYTFQVRMEHLLHAGIYARTARIEPLMIFTSVLIKIPTVLIVSGKCCVYAVDRWYALDGYNVIPACAGRKMVYITLGPVEMTMLFPTEAKTVEEAEEGFTDEASELLSRRSDA